MVDGDVIAYSVASFICALFVLEFGADKFIDHTTIIAKRTGIPQAVIALLTAGAEWEEVKSSLLSYASRGADFFVELAVVLISVARHRSSLALGNIVGSTISNILGAFSLGLLFHRNSDERVFDKSSKIYSVLLLVLTALIAGLLVFGHRLVWRIVGGVVIGLFVIYIFSITWTIYKGLITAPEVSDSDSSDDEGENDDSQEENAADEVPGTDNQPKQNSPAEEEQHCNANTADFAIEPAPMTEITSTETTPIIRNLRTSSSLVPGDPNTLDSSRRSKDHSLTYHVALLTLGILAVILSAYILSHAASTLVSEFGISDVVFGVVILSIATTIPEKFIAVVSGFRGQTGIMVANTVGSNIFLLSLCIGILWVITGGDYEEGSVKPAEIGVMLGSAVVMTLTIWFGAKWTRLIGGTMLVAYIAFLVLEFTLIHQV